MGVLMEPLYRGVSWVLLQWHTLWNRVLPEPRFLDTSWDWVLAIISVAVTVRLLLFPLLLASARSQARARALEPQARRIQEVHRDDPQTVRAETMRLYAQANVNPMIGCLAGLVQVPVFLALFHVLNSRDPLAFEPYGVLPRTLYGWTAAQFDSIAAARFFGAPLTAKVTTAGATPMTRLIALGLGLLVVVLVFVYARQVAAMSFSRPADGRTLLVVLPAVVLLSSWQFPVGVSLYWIAQNLIVLALRRWAHRRFDGLATIPA